LTITFN